MEEIEALKNKRPNYHCPMDRLLHIQEGHMQDAPSTKSKFTGVVSAKEIEEEINDGVLEGRVRLLEMHEFIHVFYVKCKRNIGIGLCGKPTKYLRVVAMASLIWTAYPQRPYRKQRF
jgi:hypothetical protein